MAQPPSQHDEDLGSVDDFAPEQPAVPPKRADLESVVLWLADTWRDAGRARSWFVGILVLFIAGGVWLVSRPIQPAAPSAIAEEPIASSRVPQQPIDQPAIVPTVPSPSDSDRAVSDDRSALPVDTPRSVPAADSSARVADRQSPARSSADASQVSPPMPGPATASAPSPVLPVRPAEAASPARAAASEPAPAPPPATSEPRSSGQKSEDTESVAIQDLLGRYRTAFVALDAAGVRQVWPSVNQRSLERAFRQLEAQDVFFFSCTIDVAGARAEATCVGTSTFIPKVGNRSPQSGPSQWNFKLSKGSAGAWLIDDAQAR